MSAPPPRKPEQPTLFDDERNELLVTRQAAIARLLAELDDASSDRFSWE